ncbi:MAG: Amuc_1100 family pilus-like protein [bacterium]
MNWFKQHPLGLFLLLIALVGTGVTSYLAVNAASRRDEAQAALDEQLQKLKKFQSQKPFPTEQNLKLVKESLEQYRNEIAKYRAALTAMNAPQVPINPQEFQDELRKAADDLRKKALEKGVGLPDKFFYGLEEYQAIPPSQQEVSELNREFQTIRRITDEIVDLKIGSLDSLKRLQMAVPSPNQAAPTPAKPGATPQVPKAPAFSTKTFTLTFTAPQEKLLSAFNLIQSSPEFLIIRSLTMDNSNPAPPSRTKPPDASASQNTPSFETPEKSQDTIQAILGRESVVTALTIEILDFPNWESPTAPKQKP